MKRTLHPRPYSRLDNGVERAAETLNQGCNVLLWGAAIVAVFMWNTPAPKHNPLHNRPATIQGEKQVGALSETKYLLAVMAGGSEARHSAKITREEVDRMDALATAATPDNCRHVTKCNTFVEAGF